MNISHQQKIFGVILFQVIIIFLFLGSKALPSSQLILLKIAPLDPSDPLRGKYQTLRYDISTINTLTIPSFAPIDASMPGMYQTPPRKEPIITNSYSVGDKVRVYLSPYGGVWNLAYTTRASEPVRPNETYIMGTVSYADSSSTRIKYGIEDYFFPENASFPFSINDTYTAEVALTKDGGGTLRKIYINGVPWP